jgi:hypothetical protein
MANHVVKQGECLSSIAKSCRLDWEHLWTLAENSELRKKRKNPNILLPGDVVVIPERRLRIEDRPVDQGHTFVKKGETVKLKIRLLAAGKALANETYTLKVGGRNLQGSTDASGLLEQPIPHDVSEGELVLDKEKLSFHLKIGHLDPFNEISGVQARLNNLGYHCGAVDGIVGPHTQSALLTFQETYQLRQTGQPDSATCEKLRSMHGC